MAILKDGASASELDIMNSAAKVYLANSAGADIIRKPNGRYMAPVSVRQTAATAAGSDVWAIRNGSARLLVIRRVLLTCCFDGTAAASTSQYELVRLTGITADSGGVSLPPARKKSGWPASTVTSVRVLDTGVTLTGKALGDTYASVGAQRQSTGGISTFDFDPGLLDPDDPLEVDAGTGNAFAIRLGLVAVIGDTLRGFVEWDEV